MKGLGTEKSPYALMSDDEDSENEVMEELIPPSESFSTPTTETPSDRPFSAEDPSQIAGSSSMQYEESLELAERDQWQTVREGRSPERGIKRQRSESVASQGSNSHYGPPTYHEDTQSANHGAPQQPHESRKAKKRRRNAEKKKEQYLQRLSRLQNAPHLVPQYPPGMTPLEAANTDPFAFLPAFNQPLVNPADFQFQPNHFRHEGQQQVSPNAWPMNMNYMQSNTITQYEDQALFAPQWSFQPQFTHIDPFSAALVSPTMPIDPLPSSVNLDAQPIITKPLGRIGYPPDEDPNSKHGLFKIPEAALDKDKKPYIPNPACTLVLESLPKTHKNPEFINNWARNACGTGANPAKVLIDASAGKALVEFTSAEAARKAWGSPQLGAALRGLKPHLLKGKPREDLIRAYWYRVHGISAGVGEIEDGEIEETGEKGAERKETKKEKKVRMRMEKEQRERDRQQKARLAREAAGAGPSTAASTWPVMPPPMSAPFNGLPPRPHQFPPPLSHQHIPPPLATNGLSTSTANPDADDMDLGSPSPINAPRAENGLIQQSISTSLNGAAPSFVPSSRIPSEPRAMKNAPTGPTHNQRVLERSKEASETGQYPAGPVLPSTSTQPTSTQPSAVNAQSSTAAMEIDLRARVLLSRRKVKPSEVTPSSSVIPGTPAEPEDVSKPPPTPAPKEAFGGPPFTPEVVSKSSTPAPKQPAPSSGDDADMFIAETLATAAPPAPNLSAPPPNAQAPGTTMRPKVTKAELAAKQQRLEQDIAERKGLMERLMTSTTKAERDAVLKLLREKNRASKEDELISGAEDLVKPSSKINLGYVPTPQRQRSYWPSHQPENVFDISDEEDLDSVDEADAQDP